MEPLAVADSKQYIIHIHIPSQLLNVYHDDRLEKSYIISSARKGLGEVYASEQTPRGWHIIRAKIGRSCAINTVFVARRPTGEVYNAELGISYPNRDWILTRILWLSGLEPGKNRLHDVDTMRRYIYIHGTAQEHLLGKPVSHGCIRMANHHILELFDFIPIGTKVLIQE
jgi:L,D-transpeptidase YbiS